MNVLMHMNQLEMFVCCCCCLVRSFDAIIFVHIAIYVLYYEFSVAFFHPLYLTWIDLNTIALFICISFRFCVFIIRGYFHVEFFSCYIVFIVWYIEFMWLSHLIYTYSVHLFLMDISFRALSHGMSNCIHICNGKCNKFGCYSFRCLF